MKFRSVLEYLNYCDAALEKGEFLLASARIKELRFCDNRADTSRDKIVESLNLIGGIRKNTVSPIEKELIIARAEKFLALVRNAVTAPTGA